MKSIREWNTGRKLNSYKKKLNAIDFDIVYKSVKRIHDFMEEKYEKLGSREKVEENSLSWRQEREKVLILNNDILKIEIRGLEIDKDKNKKFRIHVNIPYYTKEKEHINFIDMNIWDFIESHIDGDFTKTRIPDNDRFLFYVGISVDEIKDFVKEFSDCIYNYWSFLEKGYTFERENGIPINVINTCKLIDGNKKTTYDYKEIYEYLCSELKRWLDIEFKTSSSVVFGNEIFVTKLGEKERFMKIVIREGIKLSFRKVDFEDAEFYYEKVQDSLDNVYHILSYRTKVRKIAAKVAKDLDSIFSKEKKSKDLEIRYRRLIEYYKELRKTGETLEAEFNVEYLKDCIRNLDSKDTLGLIARHSSHDIVYSLAIGDVKERHYYYFIKLILGLSKSNKNSDKENENAIDMETQTEGVKLGYHGVSAEGQVEQGAFSTTQIGDVLVHLVADGYVEQAINYFKEYTKRTGDMDWIYVITVNDNILSEIDIEILETLMDILSANSKGNFLEVYYKRLLRLDRDKVEDKKDIDWNRYKYFSMQETERWNRFCMVLNRDYINKLSKNINLQNAVKSKEKTVEEVWTELGYNKYNFFPHIIDELDRVSSPISLERMIRVE